MINHELLDEVAEIMREIFEATENNLKLTQGLGKVRETPLAVINRNVERVGKKSVSLGNKVLGKLGERLNVSLTDLLKQNNLLTNRLVKTYEMKSQAGLKQNIVKATIKGIEKQDKVITQKGRVWGYKEYMEMRVRTDLQHELGEMQLKYGGDAGVVFYICNEFADCAVDHRDFQAKYYYDMNYKSFGYDNKRIEKIIRDKKVMPLQYVRENKPYLGTRPNCRHTFTPVSIEQVENIAPSTLTKELGITTGRANKIVERLTREQRRNERQIRHYDNQVKIYNDLSKASKTDDMRNAFNLKAKQNRVIRDKWRARQNELMNKNKFLERDERRETREVLLNDLGVKYNLSDIKKENDNYIEQVEKIAKNEK